MSKLEPLHYAIAHYLLDDVATNLAEWQVRLEKRQAEALAAFALSLESLVLPNGVSFAEYAKAQIDIVVDRWCQQRDALSREIVGMLNPGTVVATQHLGVAAELGQLIGLHLDNSTTALDRELRHAAGFVRNS